MADWTIFAGKKHSFLQGYFQIFTYIKMNQLIYFSGKWKKVKQIASWSNYKEFAFHFAESGILFTLHFKIK